ncbi:hypothetical protein SLNWT_3991 [Streptomyces albus]|uniref:Uncharacterized protein n=1 Tax=Streptomyces albus (strain ATCC 21838 / DSM 41398 / FERM P-419 / JCM 4703 / NBRC 107858) TaxID=1081613 RepID=A0A0B5F240_STRA4|nr:hypothetical protein SLNWT_3991 [Streptomyces albus]AOU78675.1 hypothetical protein SLNHY_3984 [Streptomyces albus]
MRDPGRRRAVRTRSAPKGFFCGRSRAPLRHAAAPAPARGTGAAGACGRVRAPGRSPCTRA